MSAEIDDVPSGENSPAVSPARIPRMGLLMLGGMGLIGAAAALVLLPGGAPELVAFRDTCAKNGATPALLAVSGLVITGIGLGLRSLARASRAIADETHARPDDVSPQVQKLGSELAQVRGALQDLRVEHVYVKEGVKELQQLLREQLAAANPESLQEAIFQMAGSLDQVGARLDERLSVQNDNFQTALQTFHNSLLTACVRLDDLHGRLSRRADASSSDARAAMSEPELSLGVLDEIDDTPSRTTRPTLRLSPAPAPASHGGAALELPRAPLPYQNPADVALAQKIAQLQVLISDADVRQVLAGLPGNPLSSV
jgi:hypothetical protein